jgi:hypothetical protein
MMRVMPTRRRNQSTNDLFEIFPDLPWTRRRTAVEKDEQIERQVEAMRGRARLSTVRRPATERVRGALGGFWRRK